MSLTISDAVHSPGSTLMPSRQNSTFGTSYLRSFESQGNIWVSHRNIKLIIKARYIFSIYFETEHIYLFHIVIKASFFR
jgi:hypothetical protein